MVDFLEIFCEMAFLYVRTVHKNWNKSNDWFWRYCLNLVKKVQFVITLNIASIFLQMRENVYFGMFLRHKKFQKNRPISSGDIDHRFRLIFCLLTNMHILGIHVLLRPFKYLKVTTSRCSHVFTAWIQQVSILHNVPTTKIHWYYQLNFF